MFKNRTLMEKLMKALNEITLPPLGDSSKKYPVELTEPEINAIHAMSGFMGAYLGEAEKTSGIRSKFSDHYLPTLNALSKRLGKFDD